MTDNKLQCSPTENSSEPWHAKGLNFACTGCGKCCTGPSGFVWVTEEEIQAIATHLNLSPQDVSRRYVRRVGDRLALTERRVSGQYDCIFLQDKKCKIYQIRPKQCKTYPFWPEVLSTPEQWQEEAKRCEGISPEAPTIPGPEVAHQLATHLKKMN